MLWWQLRMGGRAWLVDHLGRSGPRVALNVTGIALFGASYLLHRRSYRSMDLLGIEAPSGWGVGIAAAVAGLLSVFTLSWLLRP